MRIHPRIRGLPLDEDLVDYIDHRARFVLGRFSPRIPSVYVTVSDDNGPRGGVDKRCRVTTRVTGLPSITVASLDASAREAVDRALGRLARAVRRALDVARWGRSSPVRDHFGIHRREPMRARRPEEV